MTYLYNLLIGALGFFAAFGFAVFIHELGHFLAAKLFRVPVERFVIGFDKEMLPFLPRCIWERKWGETVYGVALAPLGGYVKMSGTIHPDIERYLNGEAPASAATLSQQALADQGALYHRPLYQKVVIYAAGVVMNILLAMAIIVFMNVHGRTEDAPFRPQVTYLANGSKLANGGVMLDDRLFAVDGKAVSNSEEFYDYLEALPVDAAGADLRLELYRPSTGGTVEACYGLEVESGKNDDLGNLFHRPAYVDMVEFNGPADKAGIKVGDTILAMNGTPVRDWYEIFYAIRASMKKPIHFTLRHKQGEVESVTVTPREATDQKGIGQIAVASGNPEKRIVRVSFATAVRGAPGALGATMQGYVKRLGQIFGRLLKLEPRTAQRELGGPVAIMQAAARTALLGFEWWLRFFLGLNVALAVLNMVPIPVLDGGHIVFALYEAVFGKPVSPKVFIPILNGAVYFIIAFAIIVTLNDVFKIVS